MAKIQKLAWLGDPNLKEQVVLRMKEHRVEDSIVQGIYQRYAPEKATKYRGCLLGCTLPRVVNRGAVEASSPGLARQGGGPLRHPTAGCLPAGEHLREPRPPGLRRLRRGEHRGHSGGRRSLCRGEVLRDSQQRGVPLH